MDVEILMPLCMFGSLVLIIIVKIIDAKINKKEEKIEETVYSNRGKPDVQRNTIVRYNDKLHEAGIEPWHKTSWHDFNMPIKDVIERIRKKRDIMVGGLLLGSNNPIDMFVVHDMIRKCGDLISPNNRGLIWDIKRKYVEEINQNIGVRDYYRAIAEEVEKVYGGISEKEEKEKIINLIGDLFICEIYNIECDKAFIAERGGR